MTYRRRLSRDTFIQRGIEQNAEERKRLGIPAALQTDPQQAWEALYGRRQYVYLELDTSLVQYGGKPNIALCGPKGRSAR